MTYSIKQYQKDLEKFLGENKSEKNNKEKDFAYSRDLLDCKNLPDENIDEFAVFLALFVMLDLVFYNNFSKYYFDLKKELKTLKFESGDDFLEP